MIYQNMLNLYKNLPLQSENATDVMHCWQLNTNSQLQTKVQFLQQTWMASFLKSAKQIKATFVIS